MTATTLQEIEVATPRRRWPCYPAYKPSEMAWVRRLPEHWRVFRLKNIASVRFSTVDKKTEEGETPVRLCNYTDVYNNDRIVDDPEFMQATATAEEIARFTLRRDDVLITKDSEEWNDIAVAAHVTQDMPGVLCGYHLAHIRPHPALVDGAFLSRAFSADGVRQQFHVAANGITRYGLPNRAIAGALFPIPPLDEQRAIAAFLDRETARIDELIAKKQRLIELLKEKRQAVISRAVTKGLNPNAPMKPSGIDWLGDVPAHWKIRSFRYSARIANGQVDPEQPEYRDLPLIAPNHIESGTGRLLSYDTAAEQAAESGKYLFEPGNVLYSKIRPALAKVCLAPERGLCSADMYPITPRNDLRPLYLMYFMLSAEFTTGVVLLSSRVAMPKMNRRDLGGFAVLVPPLGEQDEIIQHLCVEHAKIDTTRAAIEMAIDKLRQYRSALITAAVTGQIDVRQYGKEAT